MNVMLKHIHTRSTLIIASLLISSLASAQTSGLVSAPSMKTRKQNEISFQYRQTSRDSALDSRYRKNLQILFSPIEGMEIGFDTNLDGETGLGAKYSYLLDKDQKIRVTFGGTDLDSDPELFFGAVKDFENFEIQVGFIDANNGEAFIGYRTRLTKDLRFTVDHITGSEGSVNVRFDYYFNKNWSFDTRVYFPTQSGSPRTHRFGVAYQTFINTK